MAHRTEICPSCLHEDAVEEAILAHGGYSYQDCKCENCNAEWTNVYLFIRRANIALYCHSCCDALEPAEFEGQHMCRACGERICDACYDNSGPWCYEHDTLAAKDKAMFYERADYEYDRSKDR